MKDQSFFQAIVDSQFTPVLLVGEDDRVVYMNTAAQSLFGASVNRMEGHLLAELFVDVSVFHDVLQRAQIAGQPITERDVELVVITNSKKVKVDCTFSPMSAGDRLMTLVEFRDMEQVLRFNREETRLAQQNAMKLLLRGLAHEVKNPLGGLRGAAQLLDRQLPSADLKEYTRIIIGEADRLQRLVDDVLGPNKMLRKAQTNIHEILELVRQLILADANGNLVVERDYDPSIPELFLDRDRMIQAVLNIAQNAKQALENHGKIIFRTRANRRVAIGHHIHRLALKLEIIDNGPGIPPEMVEQIFFPMVTTRANGTGLGLSIAQTIVTQHEGVVECVSVRGKTTFSITLPVEPIPMSV